jgi:hypothetical protein
MSIFQNCRRHSLSAPITYLKRFPGAKKQSAALLLFITALAAGCGVFGGDREESEPVPGEVTPDTRGVYIDNNYIHVRLEEQDESGGSSPPNDHPVELSGAQVEAWLANIEVKPEDGDESISLVPAKQISQLSIIVAQALGDAQSDEDVVFHSFRRSGSWYGSARRATTARVFYRNGKLNLIFGDLDDFYSEQIDRTLQPLEAGYRGEPSELSGELVNSPTFAFVEGRDDWISIDTSVATASVPPSASATSPSPDIPVTAAPVAPVPAAVPAVPQDPRWAQLEERLLILDGLRRKGLITEEDYEAKKQELLEVLDL